MPNVVVVSPRDELVHIRPVRKNARGHFMGACILKNVTVLPDGLQGELLEEFSECRELGSEVIAKLTELVFESGNGFGIVTVHDADSDDESDGNDFDEIIMFEPVTGQTYRAAYVCGTEFYVA